MSTNFLSVSPLYIHSEIGGEVFNLSIAVDPLELTLAQEGSSLVAGFVVDCLPLELTLSLLSDYTTLENVKDNWIKWSKIGSLDFTIDQSNIAGERNLDWKGLVYDIKKLGNKSFVVYGANGVTVFQPSTLKNYNVSTRLSGQDSYQITPTFAIDTLSRVGVLWKGAVAGNESQHFWIDKKDRLCTMTGEGPKILDYSEYLETLTNPVMSFDEETGLVYISDGTYGFIYSSKTNSFGSGIEFITGIGKQSGTSYLAASEEFEMPKFEICTDTYDFGTRKPKTIQQIELGVNLSYKLEVQVETRLNNFDPFKKSAWKLVNPSGIAHIPCFGVEFRFRVRSQIYEWFTLDYIKIVGTGHGIRPGLELSE